MSIAKGGSSASKFYLGGTEVSKIYKGDTLVYSSGPAPLPYDAEVEWLGSSGTQYINTGYTPDGGTTVEITFQYLEAQAAIIFGSRYNGQSRKFTIGSGGGGTTIFAAFGSHSNVTLATFDTSVHKVVLNAANGTASIDDGNPVSIGSVATNNFPLFIFACNQNKKASLFVSARVMSVKIGSSMDLIPVRKDGVGYMYDKISGTLFGNDGTGAFTYGADVV